jgi:hypothetical protein
MLPHQRTRWVSRFLICSVLLLFVAGMIGSRRVDSASSGAPLLLITDKTATNKFGAYLQEILLAEGMMSFAVKDIGEISGAATLQPYRIVLLAEMTLSADKATLLTAYVAQGGRLIAMRPDPQLAPVFGLQAAGGSQTDGYIKINTTIPAGAGLPSDTLQIRGAADRYTPTSTTAITTVATLYSSATAATSHPAVTIANYQKGKSAAFAYDLAKSIVYMRQGNPAKANTDSDGDAVLRTIDLFQGNNGGSWVDRNRIPIPQADEQMRLLARVIETLTQDKMPLPRLWYFPDNAMTMLIPTGDAHANPILDYEQLIDSVTARDGNITVYMAKGGGIEGQDAKVQAWRAQGHEFGIHPYWNKPDNYPTPITNLKQGYVDYAAWYQGGFSSPKSRTVRNHQVAWSGWGGAGPNDAARIAVDQGMAMDTNFYHWGPWLKKSDGSWPHGYITGSGQPMKFMTEQGEILPLYQQLTQLVDEQLLGEIDPPRDTDGLRKSGFEELNGTQAISVSKKLIDSSLSRDYAALMTQFHVDYFRYASVKPWAEGTMDYAKSKGVPIWNADEWLNFTETRHDARFDNLIWDAKTGEMRFTLQSPTKTPAQLTLMFPVKGYTGDLIGVTVDGAAKTTTVKQIKGVAYAFVTVAPGARQIAAKYPSDPTPEPTITPPEGPRVFLPLTRK